MYVTHPTAYGTEILDVRDGHAVGVAFFPDPKIAARVQVLLNQHGLEPCTTNDLADALHDLRNRKAPESS